MRQSKMIIDINARDNIGTRASIKSPEYDQMYVQRFEGESGEPVQTLVMDIVAYCMNGLRDLAQNDPKVKDRYTFIVPDTVAPRLFQAQALVNNGVQNLADKMYLPWMDRYTENGKNIWYTSLANLSEQLKFMLDRKNGWQINFVNARTLYRYEVLPVDQNDPNIVMEHGMKVMFNQSHSDNGLYVRDMSYVNGEFTLQETSTRDRDGNIHKRYFIPRMITVEDQDSHSRFAISTTEYAALSAEDQDRLQPVSVNSRYVIMALNLRKENAKQLPVTKIQRNFKIVDANGAQFMI